MLLWLMNMGFAGGGTVVSAGTPMLVRTTQAQGTFGLVAEGEMTFVSKATFAGATFDILADS